jgi:hypothetical protein
MDKKPSKKQTTTAGIVKNKVKDKGKNVRISTKSHELLMKFCVKKGYNLGAFCEIGALDKMKNEVIAS